MKNLTPFERVIRLLLAAFSFFSLFVFLHHPVAQALFGIFGILALYEVFTGACWLMHRLGVRSAGEQLSSESLLVLGLALVQLVQSYEWWSAGWEKISSSAFVDGIAKTLGYFASQNPFSWYTAFLNTVALPNANAFAYAVEWSQIAVALTLAATAAGLLYAKNSAIQRTLLWFAVVALFAGMVMNANFYLAAGWTGPGTRASNVVMFWTQAMLFYVWLLRLGQLKK